MKKIGEKIINNVKYDIMQFSGAFDACDACDLCSIVRGGHYCESCLKLEYEQMEKKIGSGVWYPSPVFMRHNKLSGTEKNRMERAAAVLFKYYTAGSEGYEGKLKCCGASRVVKSTTFGGLLRAGYHDCCDYRTNRVVAALLDKVMAL